MPDLGHTVLVLRTQHETGLQRPTEPPGAEWLDGRRVESGPLPSLCHCDSHEGHELALPAQRKGYASRA